MEMNPVKFDLLNPPAQWPSVQGKESEFEQLIKLVQESGIKETAFAYNLEEQEVKYAVFEYIKNMESRLQILEVSLVSFHEYQQGKWTNIDQESTSEEDKEKGGECESVDVQELSRSMTVEKESVNIHVQQVKNINQESTLKKDKEKGGESVNVLESSPSMPVKKESVILPLRQINEPGTSSAAANPNKEMLTRTNTLGDVTGKEECDLEEIIKQVQLWGIADSCPFVNLGIEGVIHKVREYLKLEKSIIEALKKKFSNVKENAVTRQAVIGTVSGSGLVDTKLETEGTAGVHVVQSEDAVIETVTGSGLGDTKLEIEGTVSEEVVIGRVTGSGPVDTKSDIEGAAGVDVVKRNQSKEVLVADSVGQMDTKSEIAGMDAVRERNQSEEALVTDSMGQMDAKLEIAGVDVVKERTDEAAVSSTAKKEERGFGRGPGMHQQMLRQQQQQSIGGVKHEEDSSTIDDKPADPVQPVAQPEPQQNTVYGLLGWFINSAKRV